MAINAQSGHYLVSAADTNHEREPSLWVRLRPESVLTARAFKGRALKRRRTRECACEIGAAFAVQFKRRVSETLGAGKPTRPLNDSSFPIEARKQRDVRTDFRQYLFFSSTKAERITLGPIEAATMHPSSTSLQN
ncbi:MAG: hypothetical protein M2R45_01025 [Verrucomicrobia subdivision 3 bacterium]|nr:hypothetical protein [Limisphaerales bacterium]MCS1414137.1 hypothetical protein [Limisphaerales bacterium]